MQKKQHLRICAWNLANEAKSRKPRLYISLQYSVMSGMGSNTLSTKAFLLFVDRVKSLRVAEMCLTRIPKTSIKLKEYLLPSL